MGVLPAGQAGGRCAGRVWDVPGQPAVVAQAALGGPFIEQYRSKKRLVLAMEFGGAATFGCITFAIATPGIGSLSAVLAPTMITFLHPSSPLDCPMTLHL